MTSFCSTLSFLSTFLWRVISARGTEFSALNTNLLVFTPLTDERDDEIKTKLPSETIKIKKVLKPNPIRLISDV